VGCSSSSQKNDVAKYENGWISKFVDRIAHWLDQRKRKVSKKCFLKRKKKQIPSAADGDSPLKAFGYPHFNEARRGLTVRAGVPLSFIRGFSQPIKIGSQDYVFSGYPEEIIAFCACFENYEVIGESLSDSGHWVHEGDIKIQLQNAHIGGRLDSSVFDLLFKYTLDRITKYLNPIQIIHGIDCQLLGGCDAVSSEAKFRKALKKIKEWLPGAEKYTEKIIELFKKKGSLKDKTKELVDFVKQEEQKKAKIRQQWIGWEHIERKEMIIVTLTMYDKPNSNVRATYTLAGSKVSMRDIGEALKVAIDKKK